MRACMRVCVCACVRVCVCACVRVCVWVGGWVTGEDGHVFAVEVSGVWRVACGVWSVECGVWSVECGEWSVECGVWSVEGDRQGWSCPCGRGRAPGRRSPAAAGTAPQTPASGAVSDSQVPQIKPNQIKCRHLKPHAGALNPASNPIASRSNQFIKTTRRRSSRAAFEQR